MTGGREELRQAALQALQMCGPAAKSATVRALAARWRGGAVALDPVAALAEPEGVPGRPQRPVLVAPAAVPKRAMSTPQGRAATVHAMAHIEFNAINLALDALWRFSGLPEDYYADWLQVADEEALHFDLLVGHLAVQGHTYGDFEAHDGLWALAQRTRHDVLARMALLPRTMEARGLDVTPGLKARLLQAGEAALGPIMDTILADEIGHVAIGNRWFHALCAERGLDPLVTGRELAQQYRAPLVRGPFNIEARRAAGFSEQELAALGRSE